MSCYEENIGGNNKGLEMNSDVTRWFWQLGVKMGGWERV